jgi:hypothetical protein
MSCGFLILHGSLRIWFSPATWLALVVESLLSSIALSRSRVQSVDLTVNL